MVALAVEVLAGAVVAVAVALHVADGGHGVGGRAHGVRVAEAVLKLDLVLVPVPPQHRLHLQAQSKERSDTGGHRMVSAKEAVKAQKSWAGISARKSGARSGCCKVF